MRIKRKRVREKSFKEGRGWRRPWLEIDAGGRVGRARRVGARWWGAAAWGECAGVHVNVG